MVQQITEALLLKMNEQLGEKVEEQGLQSFLDLDFNYKSVFADYIAKVFDLTRQKITLDLKRNEAVLGLEQRLANKDKEI